MLGFLESTNEACGPDPSVHGCRRVLQFWTSASGGTWLMFQFICSEAGMESKRLDLAWSLAIHMHMSSLLQMYSSLPSHTHAKFVLFLHNWLSLVESWKVSSVLSFPEKNNQQLSSWPIVVNASLHLQTVPRNEAHNSTTALRNGLVITDLKCQGRRCSSSWAEHKLCIQIPSLNLQAKPGKTLVWSPGETLPSSEWDEPAVRLHSTIRQIHMINVFEVWLVSMREIYFH